MSEFILKDDCMEVYLITGYLYNFDGMLIIKKNKNKKINCTFKWQCKCRDATA